MEQKHKGHRQRLKSDFIANGLNSLPPQRALELLLFYAIPRSDTYPIACKLIERFNSVENVLNASCDELMEVNGISESSALLIKVVSSLHSYKYNDPIIGTSISCIEELGDIFKDLLSRLPFEQLRVICMDKELRISHNILIASGSDTSVAVEPERILEAVLKTGCSVCAIGHNHPDKSCEPSYEDTMATDKLRRLLSQHGISLLEHIIVGKDGQKALMFGDIRYLFR